MDEMLDRCILIDDRRIELWWSHQMRGADDVRSFSVTLDDRELALVRWTPGMPWSYGTLYQKERIRTTISLSEPVDAARAADLRVHVTGDVCDLWGRSASGIVAVPVYEPYYTQFLSSRDGIVVKASSEVQPLALEIVRDIVDIMLERLPEVAEHLRSIGAECMVFALGLDAYDVPEHRMGYLLSQRDVPGLGGDHDNPFASVAEANVIRLLSGRYTTRYHNELVFVHEFAHSIHQAGMDYLVDRTFADRVRWTYRNAVEHGLWPSTYGILDFSEYFATLSSIWFNAQAEGINGEWDGIRGPVNMRDELRGYDPEGYAFMADIYPEKLLPFPWDTNRDAYHLGEEREPLDFDPRFSYGGVRER